MYIHVTTVTFFKLVSPILDEEEMETTEDDQYLDDGDYLQDEDGLDDEGVDNEQ